jgi:hypothetical protein
MGSLYTSTTPSIYSKLSDLVNPFCTNFAQYPEEEAVLLGQLQKAGDIWARAADDEQTKPRFTPLPVHEFLRDFGKQMRRHQLVRIYIGFRHDVLDPKLRLEEFLDGGTELPLVHQGDEVVGLKKIVGGEKKTRTRISLEQSALLSYQRGELGSDGLHLCNLCYYPNLGHTSGIGKRKSPAFLKWADQSVRWVGQRHAIIPSEDASFLMTERVAHAVQDGRLELHL